MILTVNTTNITSGPYVGNGASDTYSYTFRVADKTQLSVYETDDAGVQTLLVVDTDYTVNDVGEDAGGTILRIAGNLPTDYQWYIRSNYIENQLTAFASQGGFFPDVHEKQMDHITFLIQQLRDSNDRTFRLTDSIDLDGDFFLTDVAADRASKYLTFDTNGDLVVSSAPQLVTVDAIFDNITLMKAESLPTGVMVQTRGYSTAGDGDWAFYYVVSPQAFDGVIDHELANGNIAVLQRLSANNVSNTPAGIITKSIQQEVNDELAGFIATNTTDIGTNAADLLKNLITNSLTINIVTDATLTLNATQNLSGRVVITDTGVILTGATDVEVSDAGRTFFAQNDTLQTLTFKTSSGTGIAVLAGESVLLITDGVNVIEPASHSLLAEFEVTGSAVTSLTVSDLDINKHKSYRIEFTHPNSGTATVEMFVNGDTTSTNYNSQQLTVLSTSVAGSRSNSGRIASYGIAATQIDLNVVGSYAMATSVNAYNASGNISLSTRAWMKSATVTNITSVTFQASLASGLVVGTKVRIYRGDK